MAFSYIHFKMKKYRIVDDIKRIKSFIQFEYLLCCLIPMCPWFCLSVLWVPGINRVIKSGGRVIVVTLNSYFE